MGMPPIDMTGRRIASLLFLRRAPPQGRDAYWVCRCICGREVVICGSQARLGLIKSCGCLQHVGHPTHGERYSFEYGIWGSLRNRCNNPKNKVFANYGGRGIKVCKRWDKFENFLADMGKRPCGPPVKGKMPKYTIDRKDNDGDYCKKNCRWATASQQNLNKRKGRHVRCAKGHLNCTTHPLIRDSRSC